MHRTSNSRVALVVPCYNEEHRLPTEHVLGYLADQPAADLLLVDDGSADATWSRIQQIATAAPEHASALQLTHNSGKAEAVRQGMNELLRRGYDYVGFWDADLATPLEVIPHFVRVLDSRPDIQWVFGARVKLLGRAIDRRPLRHVLGRVFATLASETLALPIYDTQCGAKVFRTGPALAEVLSRPFSSRWIFEVEMLARLEALRATHRLAPLDTLIYELPLLRWTDVKGSKVKPFDFARAGSELLRIRLRYGSALRGSRGKDFSPAPLPVPADAGLTAELDCAAKPA